MSIVFPPRLLLAQTPTPLILQERFSAHCAGPRIWVKRDDMTGGVISGNKVRKLEFSLAAALEQGCDTVITCGGVQSNHCRTTAVLCAQLGLKCHLVLRGAEEAPDGNLLLDKLVGANISFYPNTEYTARAGEILQYWQDDYQQRGHKAFVIPVGASDGIGLWGYIAACQELAADFQRHGISPGHIVSATGSGGTQGGLTVGNALFDLGARVWGVNVCDDAEYFRQKVLEDMQQWQQWYQQPLEVKKLQVNVIDGYVGAGYARASQEVFATIRQLAEMEGLVLDPVYTGKAFHGMVDQMQKGLFSDAEDIVFVHTGGVFGLFPQRDQLFAVK